MTDLDSNEEGVGQPVGLTPGWLALLLGWPLIVAGGAIAIVRPYVLAMVNDAQRPPIAVVDVNAIVTSVRGAATDDASTDRGLARANEVVRQLRDEGYLVIDRAYVRAAPPAVVVAPR